mgnify:CR=1 FL=1
MDIVKVFGTNLRKYRTNLGFLRKPLLKSAGCIALTSAA